MSQWGWVAIAAVALGAFYFLSKGRVGGTSFTMQNTGEGNPAKAPFGGAPAKSDSWIEDVKAGIGIAKEGAEFLKGVGLFEYDESEGGFGISFEW